MSRQPFNTTADIINGPGAASPGSVRATVDVRVVPQNGITLVGSNAPNRVAWVTMQDEMPVGAWALPEMSFKPSIADQIAVPSGSAAQYWVIYVEEVFWNGQLLYYRANVAFLPIPSDGCCGGPPPPPTPTTPPVGDDPLILIGDESTLAATPSVTILIGHEP